MGRALTRLGDLDPILVIPCGRAFALINGHHGLEAYERTEAHQYIIVLYFEVTLEDAVLEVAKANSQSILPLDNRQRHILERRLVVTGRYSEKGHRKGWGSFPRSGRDYKEGNEGFGQRCL